MEWFNVISNLILWTAMGTNIGSFIVTQIVRNKLSDAIKQSDKNLDESKDLIVRIDLEFKKQEKITQRLLNYCSKCRAIIKLQK